MNKEDLRIVFLGTPEFAVSTLEALIDHGFNIVGVITAPDRKGGRGMKKTIESDVKKYAIGTGLRVLQPTNLKNPHFVDQLRSLHANLQVVVAFRMLPEIVWDMPSLGTYNLHGSLLPQYRGAAPINWAIINGEQVTGVTSFKLKHQIDTGNIAFQHRVNILSGDNLETMHDKMMKAGANLMVKTVKAIINDSIQLKEQDDRLVSKAPKIFHKDCVLDFTQSPWALYNKIRGLSPYPVAWTIMQNKKLKIYSVKYTWDFNDFTPSTFISDGKSYLAIACTKGLLFLQEVQIEGKRRMNIKDFLNGLNLRENKLLYQVQIQPLWSW